jgi:predicted small secreted protein
MKNSIYQNYTKVSLLLVIALPLILVGCNTMEGLGTDVKHAGRSLEEAAEDAKQPCPPNPPCPRAPVVKHSR